jgi:hypothetical protein
MDSEELLNLYSSTNIVSDNIKKSEVGGHAAYMR